MPPLALVVPPSLELLQEIPVMSIVPVLPLHVFVVEPPELVQPASAPSVLPASSTKMGLPASSSTALPASSTSGVPTDAASHVVVVASEMLVELPLAAA